MSQRQKAHRLLAVTLAIAALAAWRISLSAAVGPAVWVAGDVFVAVGGGRYFVYDNAGVLKDDQSITGVGGGLGFTTGCAFNPALNKIYTTGFRLVGTSVESFADDGVTAVHPPVDNIDTSVDGSLNEAIVFASGGDFYVTHVGAPGDISHYDAAGNHIGATTAPTRTDWIDLAVDGTTMFYTDEGTTVKRVNVATDTLLADFASGLSNAYALRLLPPGDGSGGLLVADNGNIKRLDALGAVIQTYDVAGEDNWFALNLDPNGSSFWSGDYTTANFYRFNIATGALEVGPINTGTGPETLFGICLKGEPTAQTLAPQFVIGDLEPHEIGSVVNFWGAQWWKNNFMSGQVTPGVASFKGFASEAGNNCGGVWTSRPGNSSKPPSAINDDIQVIVTDSVVKSGPNISGTIKQIVTVHHDGKYGPNPGHRGGGVVTAINCTAQ